MQMEDKQLTEESKDRYCTGYKLVCNRKFFMVLEPHLEICLITLDTSVCYVCESAQTNCKK